MPLAEFFREIANKELECNVSGFSSEARKALLTHAWPGNVRELRQKIMGAVLQAQEGVATKEHLELAVIKPTSHVSFALRNDVEDAVLKGMLSKVEIGFKEDEFLYLICAYPALTDMIQRGMDKIAAVLEKETGKSFELRTTTKDEYEKWREAAYGKEEETPSADADAEFASLLGQYFPEADVE